MFGLFDPPQTKAQKRAAKLAQSLREQAARDASIEVHMLVDRQEQARRIQSRLWDADHQVEAAKVMEAVSTAQETLDRVGRFTAMFPHELSDRQRTATNAAGYEALASLELESRDFLVKVRDDARSQLVPLGVMVFEAQKLLGH